MLDSVRMSPVILVPIFWLYFICHFGDHLTQSFENIEMEFIGFSWFMLPINLQKNWTVIIAVGQKEIGLQAFGSTNCTRQLFMKVNHFL